jgi:hypothetical protein
MRVLCRHGHFAFYPRKASDVARFAQTYGFELEREEDYFTFSNLVGVPNYSLLGSIYVNIPALVTCAGTPWDVMKANNFVYNIATGLIVPKLAILGVVNPTQVGQYFVFEAPLIQPGCRTKFGQQILSYTGELFEDNSRLRISEYGYE